MITSYHLHSNFWDDWRIVIGVKLVWACLSSEIFPDEIRTLKFRTISDRDNGTSIHTQLGARSQDIFPISFDILVTAGITIKVVPKAPIQPNKATQMPVAAASPLNNL